MQSKKLKYIRLKGNNGDYQCAIRLVNTYFISPWFLSAPTIRSFAVFLNEVDQSGVAAGQKRLMGQTAHLRYQQEQLTCEILDVHMI